MNNTEKQKNFTVQLFFRFMVPNLLLLGFGVLIVKNTENREVMIKLKEFMQYQIIALIITSLMIIGLEIAKRGGFKEFFKNIFRRKG